MAERIHLTVDASEKLKNLNSEVTTADAAKSNFHTFLDDQKILGQGKLPAAATSGSWQTLEISGADGFIQKPGGIIVTTLPTGSFNNTTLHISGSGATSSTGTIYNNGTSIFESDIYKDKQVKLIFDGTNYHILNSNLSNKTVSIPFGKVDSTSTATAFTATIPEITELRDGVCVFLMNGVVTSASGCTLNINGLGAKRIYNTMAATTAVSTTFNVNYTMLFVYNSKRTSAGCWDMYYGYNANTTYTNAALGQGYATCTTATSTLAKTATLSSYALVLGGVVVVKFTNDVPAGSTLNVNSKGAKAIYFRGVAITDGIIKAGDTATFIYNGTYYHLISIDRWELDIEEINDNIANCITGVQSTGSGNVVSSVSTSTNGILTLNKDINSVVVWDFFHQTSGEEEIWDFHNHTWSELQSAIANGEQIIIKVADWDLGESVFYPSKYNANVYLGYTLYHHNNLDTMLSTLGYTDIGYVDYFRDKIEIVEGENDSLNVTVFNFNINNPYHNTVVFPASFILDNNVFSDFDSYANIYEQFHSLGKRIYIQNDVYDTINVGDENDLWEMEKITITQQVSMYIFIWKNKFSENTGYGSGYYCAITNDNGAAQLNGPTRLDTHIDWDLMDNMHIYFDLNNSKVGINSFNGDIIAEHVDPNDSSNITGMYIDSSNGGNVELKGLGSITWNGNHLLTGVTSSGTGNAFTSYTVSNGELTLTKGQTFLTSASDEKVKGVPTTATAYILGHTSSTEGIAIAYKTSTIYMQSGALYSNNREVENKPIIYTLNTDDASQSEEINHGTIYTFTGNDINTICSEIDTEVNNGNTNIVFKVDWIAAFELKYSGKLYDTYPTFSSNIIETDQIIVATVLTEYSDNIGYIRLTLEMYEDIYYKPSDGIPASDLDGDIQNILNSCITGATSSGSGNVVTGISTSGGVLTYTLGSISHAGSTSTTTSTSHSIILPGYTSVVVVSDLTRDQYGHITTYKTATLSFDHQQGSVTGGDSWGETSSRTLSWGGKFKSSYIQADAYGHISAAKSYELTLPSNPNTDYRVQYDVYSDTTTKMYYASILSTATSTKTGTLNYNTSVYVVNDNLYITNGHAYYGIYNVSNKQLICKEELSSSLSLSTEWTPASGTNEDLYLEPGDTYDTAFAKIEKAILDDEEIIAGAVDDLDARVTILETSSIDESNLVHKTQAETISGAKTFSSYLIASGGITTTTITGSFLGSSSSPWSILYINGYIGHVVNDNTWYKIDLPNKGGTIALTSDVPTNYVTTNTDQTIDGEKTFDNTTAIFDDTIIELNYDSEIYHVNKSGFSWITDATGLSIQDKFDELDDRTIKKVYEESKIPGYETTINGVIYSQTTIANLLTLVKGQIVKMTIPNSQYVTGLALIKYGATGTVIETQTGKTFYYKVTDTVDNITSAAIISTSTTISNSITLEIYDTIESLSEKIATLESQIGNINNILSIINTGDLEVD